MYTRVGNNPEKAQSFSASCLFLIIQISNHVQFFAILCNLSFDFIHTIGPSSPTVIAILFTFTFHAHIFHAQIFLAQIFHAFFHVVGLHCVYAGSLSLYSSKNSQLQLRTE